MRADPEPDEATDSSIFSSFVIDGSVRVDAPSFRAVFSTGNARAKARRLLAGNSALAGLPAFGYARGMISVLIETLNDEERLARTLASIVGASVEGVVRQVIVRDLGSTDGTREVADAAGCDWVAAGGVAEAAAQAKAEWLLLLEPGALMGAGWIDAAARHCARAEMAATFTSRIRRPLFGRLLRRERALARGLLIRKQRVLALAKSARTSEAIARGLASRRLDGEIVVAERP